MRDAKNPGRGIRLMAKERPVVAGEHGKWAMARARLKLSSMARVSWMLSVVAFRVRRRSVPRVLRELEKRWKPEDGLPAGPLDPQWILWASKWANFILVRCCKVEAPCLLRSLALYGLLRRRGARVRIHFGVDPGSRPLRGHGWLSVDGEVILEARDPCEIYVETYRHPGRRFDDGPGGQLP